jgi:hypothetical protein
MIALLQVVTYAPSVLRTRGRYPGARSQSKCKGGCWCESISESRYSAWIWSESCPTREHREHLNVSIGWSTSLTSRGRKARSWSDSKHWSLSWSPQ